MIRILTDHYERQAERNKKRNDEDYDDGVEEQLVDEDEEVGYDDTAYLWPCGVIGILPYGLRYTVLNVVARPL